MSKKIEKKTVKPATSVAQEEVVILEERAATAVGTVGTPK